MLRGGKILHRTFVSMPGSVSKRQQRRQQILAHAARVFREKGYDGASIRDISRASGVSLSSLYYYCESKQKLLYLIVSEAFRQILARLDQRLAGVTDPEQKLRVLVMNHLEYFLDHPDAMKVIVREEEALGGRYRRQVAALKREYFHRAQQIFEQLGQAVPIRAVSPRVAVLALFGMMNWIYTWYRPGRDPGPQELAETFLGIFLHGVLEPTLGRSARLALSAEPVTALTAVQA